jgi:uncharacterized protein (TIGR02231 family)
MKFLSMILRNVALFAAAFLHCTIGPACAAEQKVESKISGVTVYADRALVTRTAAVKLAPGEHSLEFSGLPAGLSEDSVSAAIRSGSAKILGLELRRQFLGEPQDEKIKALQKEIEKLTDQQRQLGNRSDVDRKQLEFADKIQIYQIDKVSKDLATKETKIEEWKGVLKFLDDTRTERMKSLFDTDVELRELNRQLRVKQAELNQLMSFRPTEARSVIVSVTAKEAAEVALDVRYIIPGAKWEPMYDARADADSKEVELTYYGTVHQRTGEDWKNVEVALSTAHPNVGAHLADLQPVYLSPGSVLGALRPAGGPMGGKRDVKDQWGLSQRLAMNAPAPPPPVKAPAQEALDEDKAKETGGGWETAALENRGTSAIYKVSRPQTIPSGERPQRVTVSVDKFKADLVYVTRPKLQPFAYLKALTRNTTENQLLGGQINVFLRGDFIGQSQMEPVAPKQEFPVYLGIDERIKVKREQLVDKTRESLWGKKLVLAMSYRITVENYTGAPQTVFVYDQIPVSQDAGIEVRSFKSEVKPSQMKQEKGEIQWKLEMKPSEKQIIEFGYEVVFPEEIVSQPGVRDSLKDLPALR